MSTISPLVNRTEPLPGYKLLERLGSGGFGEVWKCEAPGGIQKAIKFVYGDLEAAGDEGTLAEREHKALERVKQVRHPFILSLERYDIIDGRLVILTELADCNLWDRFRECRSQGRSGIPRDELLRYLHEAAEALDMMNDEHQLQHLDIKPQNLFLVHKHIKVADFGMAKVFEGMRATITGGVTPVYAAPETFEGWISRHCDQYSLAIVYQELLTGVRPFDGANTKQLLLQHLSATPNLLALPECDRPIIARALAKKPAERFPSCLTLIETLQQAVHVSPSPVTERPAPTERNGSNGGGAIRVPPPRPRDGQPAPRPANAPATQLRPPSASIGPLSNPSPAPTERSGPGVLQPTLVVGLGWLGGRIVRRLGAAAADRFGPLNRIPSLRLLAIDTDAEAIQALVGDQSSSLDRRMTLCLPLQRASHYSRNESGANVQNWLDSSLLFRLPRNPATNGVRAYGRLAMVDHLRTIMQRLQSELEALGDPGVLAETDRHVGLGIRTNRPRVYLVTSLVGGAGSGMVLDMAYLARELLRRFGYLQPEVLGLLLVPGAGARPAALANACGALAEIAHYYQPNALYELRVSPREPPITDPEPPFARLLAVPLESSAESRSSRGAVGQAAGILIGEILSPLGRTLDNSRASANRTGSAAPTCRLAVTYRFAWPIRRLVRRASLRLTERLLALWTRRDAASVRPMVGEWLTEQWTSRQLQPELLIERLHDACRAVTGQLPDAKFDSVIAPLIERAALGSKLDAYSACAVLDDVFDLVGKPLTKGEIEPTPGLLQKTVGEMAATLAAEYDKKLAEMAVHFIEQPGARLPAAEETIRQIITRLQELVQTYETLYISLEREVTELYKKLFPLIGQLDTGALATRKSTIANEVLELLRAYPKKRFQAMVAGFALSTYRGMLGASPEYLREVNFCRERLAEVVTLAERSAAAEAALTPVLGPGRDLFPSGQSGVEEAAHNLADGVSPEDLIAFDARVQHQLRRHFHSLAGYCLELSGDPTPLLEVIEQQAQSYLSERLGESDASKVFFDHFSADEQGAHRAIAAAATEAVIDLPTRAATPISALAVPDGPSGDRIYQLVEQALPEVRVLRSMSLDDIVLHRELANVPLTDLPPFSPAGRDAYRRLLQSDTPPHARTDINWSLPAKS